MSTYRVVPGDSMWRIAVKHQVGFSELLAANPQITNPSLIFPGQIINIPNAPEFMSFENEVVRLTNLERARAGLSPLTRELGNSTRCSN